MSKLVNMLKTTAIIAGTGLAAYGGIRLGEDLRDYLPGFCMIPEITQGIAAYLFGSIGRRGFKALLGNREISESDAFSIASLNAFANLDNDSRNLSIAESLEQISDNLVEVMAGSDGKTWLGSGLMITTDGYVITAHHIIEEMMNSGGLGMVRKQNGIPYPFSKENIWYDTRTDIAIIKARTLSEYSRPIRVKVSQDCVFSKGDEVRILGFRDGQKYNTMGMITKPSYTWRRKKGAVRDLFQTDARGKQGQSGGAIANGDGELIGIVVYSSAKSGEEIGVIGGAKITNALNYIDEIVAIKSARMFSN